ncbi:MAG: ABC-2 transporter permease [Acidobacteriota bacterium]|jgi:hypothetical protein|nr:ABC-2 transporter permease [Acidobacteriota bacterium]
MGMAMNKTATIMLIMLQTVKYQLLSRGILLFFAFMICAFIDVDNAAAMFMIISYGALILVVSVMDTGKKDVLEVLYATLPLTRNDIVKSKYLLSVIVVLVFMASLFFSLNLLLTEKQDLYDLINILLPTYILSVAVLSPGSFKWGQCLGNPSRLYTAVLLFSGFCFVIFVVDNIDEIYTRIGIPPVMTASILNIGSLILLYPSYRMSCKFYRARDL